MKKWWRLYLKQSWDLRVLIAAGAFALIPIVTATAWRSPAPIAAHAESGPIAVDTHIPRGFVLVPIEADNSEALDSILGSFGWVDLFRSDEGAGRRTLVARNVRLLRAPNAPNHFAALVPERDSARILAGGGVFTVVVKRHGPAGTEFVKEGRRAAKVVRRKITYESE